MRSVIKRVIEKNGHYQTLYPELNRVREAITYQTEKILTQDKDFLELYWSQQNAKNLIILTHGMEGHANQHYMNGMAQTFIAAGFDILAWNQRTCGKEINTTAGFYHGGCYQDLHQVVSHGLAKKKYQGVFLIGFSLGANITLRYLGERGIKHPDCIKGAVAISVPCDLKGSSIQIDKMQNFIYAKYFMKSIREKAKLKWQTTGNNYYAKFIKARKISAINELMAPLHGFKNAEDYYQKSSSLHVLKHIQLPCLILNALNDPFLPASCYPEKIMKSNPLIRLQTPKYGGHVGFYNSSDGSYESEKAAKKFIEGVLN